MIHGNFPGDVRWVSGESAKDEDVGQMPADHGAKEHKEQTEDALGDKIRQVTKLQSRG